MTHIQPDLGLTPYAHYADSPSVRGSCKRPNAEIDRTGKVVDFFPSNASRRRLSTAVLHEPHGEWQDGRCHSQQSMARLGPANQDRLTNTLTLG